MTMTSNLLVMYDYYSLMKAGSCGNAWPSLGFMQCGPQKLSNEGMAYGPKQKPHLLNYQLVYIVT